MPDTRIRIGQRQGHAGRAVGVTLAAGPVVLLGLGGAAAADAATDGDLRLGAQGSYDTAGYAPVTDGTNWRTELGHLVGTVRLRAAPDGSPSVRGRVPSVAVTIRGIGWIATGLLAAGAVLLAAALTRIRHGRARRPGPEGP